MKRKLYLLLSFTIFAPLMVTLCIAGLSEYKRTRTLSIAPLPVDDRTDQPEAVLRGQYLGNGLMKCGLCHGADLGGMVIADDPLLGRVVGPNLTPAGVGGTYSPEDWDRAIRYGAAPDGRALVMMPSNDYHELSDGDLADLVAWLSTLPSVERDLPQASMGAILRVAVVLGTAGIMPIDYLDPTVRSRPESAPEGAQRGEYLAHISGCIGCHKDDLAGGKISQGPPDWPPASNITPAGIGDWSEEDFRNALKGVRPDGTALHPAMPWEYTAQLADADVEALWAWTKALEPVER